MQQCHGLLRRRLWDTIKGIGHGSWSEHGRTAATLSASDQQHGPWRTTKDRNQLAVGKSLRPRTLRQFHLHATSPVTSPSALNGEVGDHDLHSGGDVGQPDGRAERYQDQWTSSSSPLVEEEEPKRRQHKTTPIVTEEPAQGWGGSGEDGRVQQREGSYQLEEQRLSGETLVHDANVSEVIPQFLSKTYYNRQARLQERRKVQETVRHRIQGQRHPYPTSGDWRPILGLLEQSTSDNPFTFGKRLETVKLKEGATAVFIEDPGASILQIMQRTGSHLQMQAGAGAASSAAFDRVTLWGTSEENERAIEILPHYIRPITADDLNASKQLADYLLKPEAAMSMVGELEQQALAPMRAVWSRGGDHINSSVAAVPWQETPPTAVAFTEHVRRLTRRSPRLVKRKFDGAPQQSGTSREWVPKVSAQLTTLLSQNGPFVTSEALDLALVFLSKHSKYDHVWQVRKALQQQNITLSVSNYECLFEAASTAGDTHNFFTLLQDMLRHAMRPSARVWTSLHTLVSRRFTTAEADVLRAHMQTKGILHHKAVAIEVLENSVDRDMDTHFAKDGATIQSFVQHRDQIAVSLGIDNAWLTRSALNRICAWSLAQGKPVDAKLVLALFESRGARANTVTLNTFLSAAAKSKDFGAALSTLKHFSAVRSSQARDPPILLDEISYSLLFRIAWHAHHWNVMRVLWRYGCMAGHVGYVVQHRLESSLISWAPLLSPSDVSSRSARLRIWTAWAGKLVVGIAQGLSGPGGAFPTLRQPAPNDAISQDASAAKTLKQEPSRRPPSLPELSEQVRDLVALASEAEPPRPEQLSGLYTTRRKRLRQMLFQDLDEVLSLRPTRPLVDMLEEAWVKDTDWVKRGVGTAKHTTNEDASEMFVRMMIDRIRVPVEVGDGSRSDAWSVRL